MMCQKAAGVCAVASLPFLCRWEETAGCAQASRGDSNSELDFIARFI